MNNSLVPHKDESICLICDEISSPHSIVEEMCSNKHHYCTSCLNEYYESLILNRKKIDDKCTLCKEPFFSNKLQAVLNEDVLFCLKKMNVLEEFQVPNNLFLMTCPLCPDKKNAAVFLIDKTNHIQFYSCENDKCQKYVCLICYKECTDKVKHSNCWKYQMVMNELEKVIQYSMKKECPKCLPKNRIINNIYEHPNVKDNNCTHMRCNQCNMNYCYVCGGHEETVDKGFVQNIFKIYLHNVGWETNNKRCPMYLNKFQQKLTSWPTKEDEATAKFEKYKTMSYIKKVVSKYGLQNCKNAFLIFKDGRLSFFSESNFDKDYIDFSPIPFIDDKIFNIFKI